MKVFPAAVLTVAFFAALRVAGFAAAASQADWDKVLEAAKKEGKVSVIGPVGPDRRDILTVPFQQKYGITVEYHADRGSGIGPRVAAERRAGKFLWDIAITGTTTGLTALIPMGAVDPMHDALILTEVKDPKMWRGGGIEYSDQGHRMIVMTPSQRGTLFINPNTIKPGEIKSYKDLLDPKYKGRIIADDGRFAGPGQATFTFFYLHPDLGPNFIRALAKQELTVARDYIQEIDSVAKGRHLVLIGVSDIAAEERKGKGIPIDIINPRSLKEASDVSPGSGSVSLFNRAPHPNAAKVYLNWLLSKEGQTGFARVNGYISARLDVPTDHSPWRVPIPGAIKTYTREAMEAKEPLTSLLREVWGQ
jgi:iron(III) transport system substrate-binding protein